MHADTILDALRSRGWTASTVWATAVDLVPVEPDGLFKCVDGRPSDHPAMRGPKALGGVYAVASLRGWTTLEGLREAVELVRDAGYVPSVHGDDHADPAPMGCGYFKLWSQGRLDGVEPPEFGATEGREAVLGAGGVYEELRGEHREREVLINLVPDTTLEPREDQRFVVDAWVVDRLGLDVARYLGLAAQTVELLGGPRVARVIVKGETAPLV